MTRPKVKRAEQGKCDSRRFAIIRGEIISYIHIQQYTKSKYTHKYNQKHSKIIYFSEPRGIIHPHNKPVMRSAQFKTQCVTFWKRKIKQAHISQIQRIKAFSKLRSQPLCEILHQPLTIPRTFLTARCQTPSAHPVANQRFAPLRPLLRSSPPPRTPPLSQKASILDTSTAGSPQETSRTDCKTSLFLYSP